MKVKYWGFWRMGPLSVFSLFPIPFLSEDIRPTQGQFCGSGKYHFFLFSNLNKPIFRTYMWGVLYLRTADPAIWFDTGIRMFQVQRIWSMSIYISLYPNRLIISYTKDKSRMLYFECSKYKLRNRWFHTKRVENPQKFTIESMGVVEYVILWIDFYNPPHP